MMEPLSQQELVSIAFELRSSSLLALFPNEFFVAVGEVDLTKPFEFYGNRFGVFPGDAEGFSKTCFPCWVDVLNSRFAEGALDGLMESSGCEQCVRVKRIAHTSSVGIAYLIAILTDGEWRVLDVTLVGHNTIDDDGKRAIDELINIVIYNKFFYTKRE